MRQQALRLMFAMCLTASPAFGAPPESPDTVGDVGTHSSMVLDAAGNPVISYRDTTNQDLKVLHCNDPNCAGGDESIQSPDTVGNAGYYTSLKLDAAGNPVISYLGGDIDLKVMHCNDPNCAGGNESIQSPDTVGNVGYYTSLELDAAGNPVVSYYDSTNGDLKLLHCNDVNCVPSGNAVSRVDTAGNMGSHTSLALDAVGHPVISYHDVTNGNLKVVHCDDVSCQDGQTQNSVVLDSVGIVGTHTSLVLDASGRPVISYYDATNSDLKLAHCGAPSCATGGPVTDVDGFDGSVGQWTSLALDAVGDAVISYFDSANGNLKVVHCDDGNCEDGQTQNAVILDSAGNVGLYTSLVLDSAGYPVVSYYDATNDVGGNLKVVHCDNPHCAPWRTSINLSTPPTGSAGWYNTGVTIVVSVEGPGVFTTRCALDPASPPLSYYSLPPACAYLGAGAAVTADGLHTVYAASRESSNMAEYPFSVSFKIDQTDPLVFYSGNLPTYTVDQQVNINCTASDAVSGIATANCLDIVRPAATLRPGVNDYTASATDNAGNTATASVSFTVVITPPSLCNLTLQYGQGSLRYQTSTAAQKRAFVIQVRDICANTINQINPFTPPAQKQTLILAYKQRLIPLVTGAWLTQSQANILGRFAAEL